MTNNKTVSDTIDVIGSVFFIAIFISSIIALAVIVVAKILGVGIPIATLETAGKILGIASVLLITSALLYSVIFSDTE